ncbi:SRPBCC domain-containing protein [Sulfidibacter corallicola]|uniref:SRPBCC domain-containing protein n=1 Tax=Sulfidibacter corallicola TaxID=2818388 RepID=A0A8A4TML7_SULCO|nr:SRPBCC domain-containing protein [Sulfidibacter corallicola]QTD50454.1 SRPBCC domain-containing protein [Sulfidibacter corallicola]
MSTEITREIFIEASPETVYPYLTEQDKASQWFGTITEMEGRPGGRFRVGAHEDLMVTGEFVETVPNRKVVFTWGGIEGLAGGESTVEITLRATDGGTHLTLRHYDLPNEKAAENFGQGWVVHAFPLLKLVAEGGSTEERCFRRVPTPRNPSGNGQVA